MSQSPNFDPEDDDTFFELAEDGGVAIDAHFVSLDESIDFTIAAIFDLKPAEVAPFGDARISTTAPQMDCQTKDLADIRKGLRVTFPNLAAGEDGYQRTYSVEDWGRSQDGPNQTTVLLKDVT